ncbi:MAG: hypothetical protein ACKVOM_02805 [Ferruginibacter sp.]
MIFDYLYYKLHHATLKGSLKDVVNIAAPAYIGCLIGANTLVLNAFLAKTINVPFLFSNPKLAGFFCLGLIVVFKFYYNQKRVEGVLKKYSIEDNKQRIKGNIFVSLYVAASFLVIFAVAFFKPGQLNH